MRGLTGLVASIVTALMVRWGAVANLEISTEFAPLAGPGPTIFFTTLGALGAMGVFAVVRHRADRPERLFRRIAAGVLLLSFLPDVWLLSEGAAGTFPGATPTAVGVLMAMHTAAAVVIVWFLTVSGPTERATPAP
jgi:hypothetical protein